MSATLSEAKVIHWSFSVCGAFSMGSVVLHSFTARIVYKYLCYDCSMHLKSNTEGVAMQLYTVGSDLFSQQLFVWETLMTSCEPSAVLAIQSPQGLLVKNSILRPDQCL